MATCSGSSCVNQCKTNHPLTCNTSGSPACGSWDFESSTTATEGWVHSIPANSDCVVNVQNSNVLSNPSGGRSLAVHCVFSLDPSGFSSGLVLVTAPLCAGGQALDLGGKTAHFRINTVIAPGALPLGSGDEVYPSFQGPNGPSGLAISSFQPAGTWTTIDTPIPSDGNRYTDIGISIVIRKDGPTSGTWDATFYIDDVQILP
jgi:hypothetical protein